MSELPKALPKSVMRWLRAGADVPPTADPGATVSAASASSAQAPRISHPDANLLSALVEQALTTDERSQVMEHLSRCAECRELVALSLPELQPAEMATRLVADRRPFWSGKPAWGAVAASVIVVGAAVLLQYQAKMPPATAELASYSKPAPSPPRQEEGTAGKNEIVGNVAQTSVTNGKPAAKPASRSRTVKEDRESANKFPNQQRSAGLVASEQKSTAPVASAEPARHDEAGREVRGQIALSAPAPQTARKAEAQPATPPKVAESKSPAENGSPARAKVPAAPAIANATADAITARAKAGGNIADAQPGDAALQDQASNPQHTTVEVQGEYPKVQTESSASSGGARLATTLAKQENVPTFRWTLSSNGAVLRSANRGKTWQRVPLNDNATFRALASVGHEVWVGGAGGTLYHSADSGSNWQRLTPIANGSPLKDDITALDFRDAQHGRLTTSSGEVWTTSDGGQTWNKAE